MCDIGELDPSTKTFTTIDISSTVSGDSKYYGGVLAPNGKIYFVPTRADNIGELDPSTKIFNTIDISGTISSDWKYFGGVLAPNGKIYFVPNHADNIGELDIGNHEPAYEASPDVAASWSALLSPYFNKF